MGGNNLGVIMQTRSQRLWEPTVALAVAVTLTTAMSAIAMFWLYH